MRVYFSLLCEHASEGSFGRLDLHGILPQKQMAIPHLNYVFKGQIVVSLSKECAKLKKKLNFYKQDKSLVGSFEFPEYEYNGLEKICVFPLIWPIDSYGEYKIEIVFEDGLETYEREFKVIDGSAASFNFDKEEIPPQIMLGSHDQLKAQELFKKIFKKAKTSILVVDNYWTTKELAYLLAEIKPSIALSLYINAKKEFIKEAEKVKSIHPNTIVRSSNKVHDRYICLDGDAEMWHIGASLNHAGKKVTTVNKVSSIEAINKLKVEINNLFPGTF